VNSSNGNSGGKSGLLRIGELARLSDVSADTLRHYERKGLLKPLRGSNGYREYPRQAAERVRMIRLALALGFRLDDLARIFKIREAGGAPCRQVRNLAANKLAEIETLLEELTAMRGRLRKLLKDWDVRLETIDNDQPARLLETLAATGVTRTQALAPLRPNSPKRKQIKKGRD
jgi:DNA-binding transcriptional MerR regulator